MCEGLPRAPPDYGGDTLPLQWRQLRENSCRRWAWSHKNCVMCMPMNACMHITFSFICRIHIMSYMSLNTVDWTYT